MPATYLMQACGAYPGGRMTACVEQKITIHFYGRFYQIFSFVKACH
jgi:hypothetical protein